MSQKTLILNESNVVPGSNNSRYKYDFPSGFTFPPGSKIALQSMSIYYSWYNISAEYNNNTLQYLWFNMSGNLSSLQTIVIPDGNYDVETLNNFIQNTMKTRGHYLKGNGGTLEDKYFIELFENPTYYAVQIDVSAMPTSLGSYTKGGTNWNLPSSNPRTPQIILNPTSNFNKIIGYNNGSYPPTVQSTDYSIISPLVPRVSPVSSFVLRCDKVSNGGISQINDAIYTATQGIADYGDLLFFEPNSPVYYNIMSGSYSSITFTFVDQDYNPMKIIDPQLIMQFSIITP